jgi:galactonate dehydratase
MSKPVSFYSEGVKLAGYLILPDRPGWGTEPNEGAMRAHPPKRHGGLFTAGRKN